VLGVIGAGELKRHHHPGGPGVGRDQAIHQRRFVERDLLDPGQPGLAQVLGALHQSCHGQVVAFGLGVLEVGDRVDPDGMGDLPGLLGQLLDDAQSFASEDLFVPGLEDEQDVVGLGVGVLQGLEGVELGVILAKKHPVVGSGLEMPHARCGGESRQQPGDHDRPAPADDPSAIGRNQTLRHAWHRSLPFFGCAEARRGAAQKR
jgi:hypothetical protein